MTGTASQVEWAEGIRFRVGCEFDRVANALKGAMVHQIEQVRAETQELIAIVEEHRAVVLANDRAGYFIHDWQELSDQVRQLVGRDVRYHEIKRRREARQLEKTAQVP